MSCTRSTSGWLASGLGGAATVVRGWLVAAAMLSTARAVADRPLTGVGQAKVAVWTAQELARASSSGRRRPGLGGRAVESLTTASGDGFPDLSHQTGVAQGWLSGARLELGP
jgi:hypothetical protein